MQEFTEKTTARSRRVAQGGVETSSRVGCGLVVQVNGVVIPASMCMLPSGELVFINMFGDVYVGNAAGVAGIINAEYGAGDVAMCSEDGCMLLQGVEEQPAYAKLSSIIHILVDGSPVSEVTLRRHDGYFIVLRAYREPVAIPESQLTETLTNWLCGNRQCTVTLVECPPNAPCRKLHLFGT